MNLAEEILEMEAKNEYWKTGWRSGKRAWCFNQ
jgi:hypothetical protein